MSKVYSIAIYPDISIMKKVKAMKDELASFTGWFGSRNSKAHVTICECNAVGERELLGIKSLLEKLCATESALNLTFDHIGIYENKVNGVVCLLPNKESENMLKPLMKRIRKSMKVKLVPGSSNPHITIGRKLNNEQLSLARELFINTEVSLNFICDRIVLRVREDQNQFAVIDEFVFQGEPLMPIDEQLSMF